MLALLAAVATIGCAERAEPSPPVPAAPRWVIAGPVAFADGGGAFRRGKLVSRKAGVSVDAGGPVTVRVLTQRVAMDYRHNRRPPRTWRDGKRVLRFAPCDPDTPTFSRKGATVGPRTGFAGMLMADRRTCARIRVSRGGESWVARIPIGRRCTTPGPEACSSRRAAAPIQDGWVQPSPSRSRPSARACSS